MSNDQSLKPDEYTYPEKLALVSQGLMAPETIGVTSAEDAQKLQIMDGPPKEPFLGDFCTFEVSEVPIKLRALWAKQDRKIVDAGDNFEATWIEEFKETHLLQARLRCGNVSMILEQTVSDVVLGFAAMLAQAGSVVAKMKQRIDKGNFAPPVQKDPLLEQKGSIDIEATVLKK